MGNKKYAVFTMDVETFTDTECVSASNADIKADMLDGFDEYIKILDRHGIKSTLFTVGRLAPKIKDRLEKYIGDGHKLALHSYNHVAPMELPLESFKEQTAKAKKMLDELFKTEIKGFRAPCFSIDKSRLDALQELGFTYDSSHLDYPVANHVVDLDLSDFNQLRDGIFKRDNFYEFSMSRHKIFGHRFPVSGGGYVRLSSWCFIKNLIWKYINRNDYYVFYLHPFELTKEKIPTIKNLKMHDRYYLNRGLRTYGRKVERIINMLKKCNYEFVTFEELVDIMNKEKGTADAR